MRYVLLLLLWITAAPPQAATVLIVGDSLSDAYNIPREAGWASLLEVTLGADYRVINASISGETTAGAARRLPALLAETEPDVMLLILGGNDGLRGLDPSQVERNLANLIRAGRAAGTEVLLMQIRIPPNLGPAYVRRFEGVYPRLAEDLEVTLVPFFLEDIFDQAGMMMGDGIHPTEQAQPLMLQALLPAVQAALAEAATSE